MPTITIRSNGKILKEFEVTELQAEKINADFEKRGRLKRDRCIAAMERFKATHPEIFANMRREGYDY